MNAINIFEAKTNLSKYISSIEEGKEPYIIIMRNGKPVAKLIPYEEQKIRKIGTAKGLIPDFPDLNDFNSVDVEKDFDGNGGLL